MPVVSARNVQAAPSYNWFLALRRHLLEMQPDSVIYVVVPRTGEDTTWKAGADWAGPRTYAIPVTQEESQFLELGLVTREVHERFNERFGDLWFDMVLSEKPMVAATLKQLTEFHIRQKSRGTLVVNRDQFTIDDEWFKVRPEIEMLQAVGWWSAPTIWQSPHQKKRAIQIAGKHLTFAHLKKIDEQSVVFPLGVDCADIEQIVGPDGMAVYPGVHLGAGEDERVRINYSHKLFIEQKFIESLKLMDSVFAGGRPVELQIVTGSAASKLKMVKAAREYAYITTFGGMNRTEFLRQASTAQLFVSNSIYEDFSATVVEQMYLGLLPVLLDKPWSRYLVPDGYPLLFRSMEEGQMMVRYAVDHLEELQEKWVEPIRTKIREEFDLSSVIPAMIEWMTGLNLARLERMPAATDSIVQLVEDAYRALPERFDLPAFYEAIKKVGNGLDPNRDVESRSTSRWMLVDVLVRQHPELEDLGDEQVAWRKHER
jgi:hypothetical protein